MKRRPTVGLGVLSWRSPKTLGMTLDSYQKNNLFAHFDQTLIYFNGLGHRDRALAMSRGLPYAGGPNQGIAAGMIALAQQLRTDYVVLVQNDCPLVESPDEVYWQLDEALQLLERNEVQLMRMRHRFAVGEGFSGAKKYLNYYPASELHPDFQLDQHPLIAADLQPSPAKSFRRLLRPGKARRLLGRSIYVEQAAEALYPGVVNRRGPTMLVDSRFLNFSDQSLLVSKSFFLDVLMRYVQSHPSSRKLNGFQVPEICLNCRWWRAQRFMIGQARGLFTHNRYDGSFRACHAAYEPVREPLARAA